MTELSAIPTAAQVTGRFAKTIFAVTALGAFMASLDLSIVNVAFPALERGFPHDPRASLAWVLTSYAIVFGSLLVVAGRTADRLGSRRVFFAGLVVFCLGSLLCGVAPSVPTLIAGRVIQGVGAAALLPSSLSLLLASYSRERRSQVVALWGGIGALAIATGPSLGALLITTFGWRAAFYVNLPIGLFALVVGRRVLEETEGAGSSSSPDYVGVILLSVSLATLVLAITEGPTWGWASAGTLASVALSILLGAVFLRRSSRHDEPVLDLRLFRTRTFSVANAVTLLYSMGFFAMLLGNILFLTSVWHYSIIDAGLAVTPGPLVVAAVSGPAGRLAGRFGFRRILTIGFTVFAAGLVWYVWRVSFTADFVRVWLPGTIIVGIGIGLTFPVISAAAVSSLDPARYAVGSAVNQTARQIGGALGVAILVVILGAPTTRTQALHDFEHLWWFVAAMAAAAGVTAALLGPAGSTSIARTGDDVRADETLLLEEGIDGEIRGPRQVEACAAGSHDAPGSDTGFTFAD